MAKYTVALSSIICAGAGLQDPNANEVDINFPAINYDGIDISSFDYKTHNFYYGTVMTPNYIIEKYAYNLFMRYTNGLIQNFTNDNDLNTAIMKQLINTFCRHFWGYEIGQENPLYWWTLVKAFFDEQMPLYIQAYQEMIINKQNFITGLSHSTNHATGNLNNNITGTNNGANNSLSGNADTPQNQLNFSLNSADPTKDYNFEYASNVTGAKTTSFDKTTSKTDQNTTNDDTTQSYTRNQTIMSLVNQLDSFSDGIYLELFSKAKDYGLFMLTF